MHTSQLPPRPAPQRQPDSTDWSREERSETASSRTARRLLEAEAETEEEFLQRARSIWRSQAQQSTSTTLYRMPDDWSQRPTQPTPAPAMQHQHRVYILNCTMCKTFLSDRGMRAVLLLKPSITLFSTDAAPLHSGPQFAQDFYVPEPVERTCDCMTQSLACYGCGTTIGYHIIAPCAVCTQSVSQHAKSANGHRYVFHYRAVVARERKYRNREAGIVNPNRPSSSSVPAQDMECDSTTESVHPRRNRSSTLCGDFDTQAPPSILGARRFSKTLKEGDTVYWHHLRMGGERSSPTNPDAPLCTTACER